jgi:proteasome lid subunit RPN8/RPN11
MTIGTRSTVLVLPDAQRGALEQAARAGYPREACGLLIGRRHAERTEVLRVEEARNLERERLDRFELDPADHLRGELAALAAGLDVVGIWHTHPDHPARPSPLDLERAFEGWSYLILSVGRARVAEVRSWRLVEGAFRPEEIEA